MVACAAVAASLPPAPIARAVAAVAVLAVAGLGIAWRRSRALRPIGHVQLDGSTLVRHDEAGTTRLADTTVPFGVTVLADHARTRALVAFTTPTQTRYVQVHNDDPTSGAAEAFFAAAATVADHDVVLGATQTAGALGVRDGARLLGAVRSGWPSALERIFLSSADGSPIVLDRQRLLVGGRGIDLRAPLEWRGFTFHESVGQVATIYQATWVRQGDAELVLVAPMPAELTSWGAEPRRIFKRNARDERLMQALPDAPPPRELRTAIDRLFMLPLRKSLDRASLATHVSSPPARRRALDTRS